MRRNDAKAITLAGCAFIAVTYGLARFSLGLFLPAIRAEIGFGAETAGIVGALPFAGFVPAAMLAPAVGAALGPRVAGAVTAALAVAGLAVVAVAGDPVALGLGVLVCGAATGLSLPIMAKAVSRGVPASRQGRANATVNASTSLGIAAAVLAVLLAAEAWRWTYGAFAGLALLAALAVFLHLPGRAPAEGRTGVAARPRLSAGQWLGMTRIGLLAGAVGFVSAIYWVFAPDFVTNAGGLSRGYSAGLWLAVGVVGLAGGLAGDLIDRHGTAVSHGFAVAVLAAALALLAANPGDPPLAMISAGAFGAAYMTLTGLYLVEGTRLVAERPALGPLVPSVMVAVGQMIGSAVAGWSIGAAGYATAFGAFASLGLVVAVLSPWLAAIRRPAYGGPAMQAKSGA